MPKIDQKGVDIINALLRVIANEMNEEIYPDDMLAKFCEDAYEPVSEAVFYLKENGAEPDIEAEEFLARFVRGAGDLQ